MTILATLFAQADQDYSLLGILCGICCGLPIYFIPSMVAFFRNHPNKIAILVLNIFLGWSLIGWVVALVWALIRK